MHLGGLNLGSKYKSFYMIVFCIFCSSACMQKMKSICPSLSKPSLVTKINFYVMVHMGYIAKNLILLHANIKYANLGCAELCIRAADHRLCFLFPTKYIMSKFASYKFLSFYLASPAEQDT